MLATNKPRTVELTPQDEEFALELLRRYELFLEGCNKLFRDYRRRHDAWPACQAVSKRQGSLSMFVFGRVAEQLRDQCGIRKDQTGIRLLTLT